MRYENSGLTFNGIRIYWDGVDMQLSTHGKLFIQGYEKLFLAAYVGEDGIPTIGWGHTGPEVTRFSVCTIEQAEAWFDSDTASAVNEVNETILVTLTQDQFDALVSFTFNVGDHAEAKSTLVEFINEGDFTDAEAQFLRWDHVGKQVSGGLLARRKAEAALFMTPAA